MRFAPLALALLFTLAACGDPAETPPEPVAEDPVADAAPPADVPEEAPAAGIDQSDPAAMVTGLMAAINAGDFESLRGLCDPTGANDGETQGICDSADNAEMQAEMAEALSSATVTGPAVVNGTEASVPVNILGDDEAFELVQRDGVWYLSNV